MKRNQLLNRLFLATVATSVLTINGVAKADPVDDARFAVHQAHDALDAADARLHSDSAACDEFQADLSASRGHTQQLSAALDAQNHRLAVAQFGLDNARRDFEPLQRQLRDAHEQAVAAGAAAAADQDSITRTQGRLDGMHADMQAQFDSRRDIERLREDKHAFKDQIDSATDRAIHRLSETHEYRRVYDDNDHAQRELAQMMSARHVDERDVVMARDHAALTKARLDDLVNRTVDTDPFARTARVQMDAVQHTLDSRENEATRDFARSPEVIEMQRRLASARAALDADNARLARAQSQEAGTRAALDQRQASLASLTDAAHHEQDSATDLASQLRVAQDQTAALETRSDELASALAADRAGREQAQIALADREQTLGAMLSVPQPQPVVVLPPPPERHEDRVDVGLGGLGISINLGDYRDKRAEAQAKAAEQAQSAERARAEERYRQDQRLSEGR